MRQSIKDKLVIAGLTLFTTALMLAFMSAICITQAQAYAVLVK